MGMMRMTDRQLLYALASGLAVLGAACSGASRTATGSHGACGLQSGDTIYVGGGPVYRDCAVDVRAQRQGEEIRSDYRPSTNARSACFSAELEFVVDTLGLPETRSARIVRTNNQDYATAVLATLPRWRYEPARLGNVHVRQIVQEKRSMAMATTTVIVPAGSPPPTRGSAPPRGSVPRC